jgi:hypothetical protein
MGPQRRVLQLSYRARRPVAAGAAPAPRRASVKDQNKRSSEQSQPEATPVVAKAKAPKRLTEAQLVAKYPHVQLGTLRWETEGKHAGKQTVEAELACGHVQRVATSDLFQVKQCEACKKPVKKAAAKEASPKGEAPKGKDYPSKTQPAGQVLTEELKALARNSA